jgi:hypothetical protein
MAAFSSQGPTYDGRIKPDVVAPGYFIISARSSLNAQATCSLKEMAGTSMATPTVASAMGLVRQYFREGWYPSGVKNGNAGFIPMGSLLKAIAINGASTMSGVIETSQIPIPSGPNNYSGFGRVSLSNNLIIKGASPAALKLAVIGDYGKMKTLKTGEVHTHSINVVSATPSSPVKITLVWTDAPSSPSATRALVNNLDLIVVGKNGVPLNVNGRSTADVVNNVEQVVITAGNGEDFTIQIKGTSVIVGPQPYSLVVSGAFTSSTLYVGYTPSIAPTPTSSASTTTATTSTTAGTGTTKLPGIVTVAPSSSTSSTTTTLRAPTTKAPPTFVAECSSPYHDSANLGPCVGNGCLGVIDCGASKFGRGMCVSLQTARTYMRDQYCDDGRYGPNFLCAKFNNDGNACGAVTPGPSSAPLVADGVPLMGIVFKKYSPDETIPSDDASDFSQPSPSADIVTSDESNSAGSTNASSSSQSTSPSSFGLYASIGGASLAVMLVVALVVLAKQRKSASSTVNIAAAPAPTQHVDNPLRNVEVSAIYI